MEERGITLNCNLLKCLKCLCYSKSVHFFFIKKEKKIEKINFKNFNFFKRNFSFKV